PIDEGTCGLDLAMRGSRTMRIGAPAFASRPFSATGRLVAHRVTATIALFVAVIPEVLLSTASPAAAAHVHWTPTGSMGAPRANHTATRLADGRVLVVGGSTSSAILASAEIYDPASGTWTATNRMSRGRVGHTATGLADGRVLVAGGFNRESL